VVNKVRWKFHAFRHRACDNGCRRSAKCALEQPERPNRNARRILRTFKREPARAYDAGNVLAEHERISDQEKRQAGNAEIQEVFREDVARVFCPDETGFNHAKPCLHEKHQERRNQHPDRIDGLRKVDHISG